MKRPIGLLISVIVLASASLSVVSKAQAGEACAEDSLKGSWGYSMTTLRPSNVGVGVFTFDGKGGATGAGIAQISGDIFEQTWEGTYKMGAQCTVNASLTDNRGAVFNLYFVLVSDGKEFEIIRRDPGHSLVGFAKKQ